MTDYNKKTYRVDDVAWNASPQSTFKMKEENISYLDYYYKVRSYYTMVLSVGNYIIYFPWVSNLISKW